MTPPLLLLTALLMAPALWGSYTVLRFVLWIAFGGTRVVIPWNSAKVPYSRFAQRRRTQDNSRFPFSPEPTCVLVFWKRLADDSARSSWTAALDDVITLFSGVKSVATDFGFSVNNEPWVISAGKFGPGRRGGSGAYYTPLHSLPGAALARIDISNLIDVHRFLSDLRSKIADPSVRAKGIAIFAYAFGVTRPNRLTCSGLIGAAIRNQPESPLAQALEIALHNRPTWGEITPADIARAAAILELPCIGHLRPLRLQPVLRPRMDRLPRTQ